MSGFGLVKTKLFIKFLKLHNCYWVGQKSSGSYFYWKKPSLTRRITIREADKDITPFHIKTNLEILGLNFEDLEAFLNKKK